ncbi:hypothetical protein [Amycolatopsis australiensis]|uniref:Uncharacterized protein n=1 Tax=Amycolatopsis australiensis TaxID=546364 RepID=A0A1K1LLL9_9PSEU|nr:hypothetical protein [Amycolatopsis australiensis]SFW11788.1 hypothetical protein SAMN04489730_0058 [Amycolatopsis australiensis]
MSTRTVHPSLAVLHHDAVVRGEALQALVVCCRINDPHDPRISDLDDQSVTAWDVIANLDTALHAS